MIDDLKEAIAENDLIKVSDLTYWNLLDNDLEVKDIDKIAINILRLSNRAKFKYYLLNKYKDNVKCMICHTKDNLRLHHLKSVSNYPELEFDKDNVTFLCDLCHQLIHARGESKLNGLLTKKVKQVFKSNLNHKLQIK